ncbi:MAG: flap endonuclease-1 [Candidatus Aenigmatarchaeota archaeon]|nr:MAG: flap endonuclease-1 [Candidatus Aenigmarchaeota archaeon]
MGVNLGELVPGKQLELEDLSGKTIAIDAFNSLYQFLSIIRDRYTGQPLRDSKGRVTSHLSGLFYRTARLLEAGISPVYVFDGEPPAFKTQTAEERQKLREKAEKLWKEAVEKGDLEQIRLYAQASGRLTEEMVQDAKKLLDLMGIPWIQAPSEGEAQAAWLAKAGKVWAVGSQDWDCLLFGAPRLVRNLAITGRRKLPRKQEWIEIKPELVELQELLEKLGIDRKKLILLGILIGTDYNPGGIKGIGPKTALKLVREKSLKDILKEQGWDFPIRAEDILEFFLNPPVKEMEIPEAKLQPEKLREFMVEEHDFSAERVEKVIQKLKELRQKPGLSRWF